MESDEQKPPWKSVSFCSNVQQLDPVFGPWPEITVDPALQNSKDKIALYEKYHVWELAKKMANPYECIYTQDDSHFHPSLCLYKPLSRSFYKMIEILSVLEFFGKLPKTTMKLRTAHVAEGPGGFIEAFLERAEKYGKKVTSAVAMTLKPTDNHTPGWRRASNFLQRHKEVILHYGIDGTGDIYQKGNQDSFIDAVKPGVHLFTADGGFDFSTDYLMQEKRIYHLLVCSALTGLQCLLPGGAFVLKFFDIYAKPTQTLISIIISCFQKWTLYKPATSRPCNSERYLLCYGFRSLSPSTLALLTEIETQSLRDLYPSSETSIFEENIQKIVKIQKAALTDAEMYIQNPLKWKDDFNLHFRQSITWCSEFNMPATQRQPITAAVQAVVSQMSARVAVLQSRKPDVEISHPLPCGLEVSTLSVDSSCDTPLCPLPNQTDEGSHVQIQEVSP
jgi:23S rRNA U2552 (ribose-2'-O)-methylase RlmE/FtsJ